MGNIIIVLKIEKTVDYFINHLGKIYMKRWEKVI